jgi:hypothetical protein
MRFCAYCGVPFATHGIDIPRLCARNEAAHQSFEVIIAELVLLMTVITVFGWGLWKMYGDLFVMVPSLVFVGLILSAGVWHVRFVFKPQFPEVFREPTFRFGLPIKPPSSVPK